MKQIQLLEALQADVRKIILAATRLLQEDNELLIQSPAENKWSAAQVIAHLNSYGRYYLPAIESGMSKNYPAAENFKAGWLGDYFTKVMKPGTKKMQSPKDHRPKPVMQSKPEIDEFLKQQQLLLELLEKAKQTNIGKIRIPISLAKFVKLKLGDTFRFLIVHQQRHFVQIKNILSHENIQQPVW
jgi:hypothetical protein